MFLGKNWFVNHSDIYRCVQKKFLSFIKTGCLGAMTCMVSCAASDSQKNQTEGSKNIEITTPEAKSTSSQESVSIKSQIPSEENKEIIQSAKKEENQEPKPNSTLFFKVMSVNVAIFPPLQSFIRKNNFSGSTMGKDEERALAIAKTITKLSPDVVLMQEFWSNAIRKQFYQSSDFNKIYPYAFEDTYYSPMGFLGSGLAIYSKFPIKRNEKYYYKNFRGPEILAHKGVLIAEIDYEGTPLFVATTHLQAGSGGEPFEFIDKYFRKITVSTADVALNEMKEANEFIKAFVKDDLKDRVVLFGGDLNINKGNWEYENIFKAFHEPIDTYCKSLSFSGTTWANNEPEAGKIIDYIFSLGKSVGDCTDIIGDITQEMTDHLAILGSFSISKITK